LKLGIPFINLGDYRHAAARADGLRGFLLLVDFSAWKENTKISRKTQDL